MRSAKRMKNVEPMEVVWMVAASARLAMISGLTAVHKTVGNEGFARTGFVPAGRRSATGQTVRRRSASASQGAREVQGAASRERIQEPAPANARSGGSSLMAGETAMI